MSLHYGVTWTVYVLECEDGSLYTGITTDLARRFKQHQSGRGARYTRSHRPVRVRYTELAADQAHALKREVAIKRMSRKQKLKLGC